MMAAAMEREIGLYNKARPGVAKSHRRFSCTSINLVSVLGCRLGPPNHVAGVQKDGDNSTDVIAAGGSRRLQRRQFRKSLGHGGEY